MLVLSSRDGASHLVELALNLFCHTAYGKQTAIMALTCGDIFKFIFAFFIPPLGVFLEVGCNKGTNCTSQMIAVLCSVAARQRSAAHFYDVLQC